MHGNHLYPYLALYQSVAYYLGFDHFPSLWHRRVRTLLPWWMRWNHVCEVPRVRGETMVLDMIIIEAIWKQASNAMNAAMNNFIFEEKPKRFKIIYLWSFETIESIEKMIKLNIVIKHKEHIFYMCMSYVLISNLHQMYKENIFYSR